MEGAYCGHVGIIDDEATVWIERGAEGFIAYNRGERSLVLSKGQLMSFSGYEVKWLFRLGRSLEIYRDSIISKLLPGFSWPMILNSELDICLEHFRL